MSTPAGPGPQGSNSILPKINLVMNVVTVKVIFLLHFITMTLALACLNWMPTIYIYYNTFFFVLLFWSLHTKDRNPEPILLAAVINVAAIALDIICICNYHDQYSWIRGYTFSLVFLIINLVLRPFTTFILARLYFSKNRSNFSTWHQNNGIADNGSSLTSTIRKLLFLNTEQDVSNMHSPNIDASGLYRPHLRAERKTSVPITSVLSVSSQQHQIQTQQQVSAHRQSIQEPMQLGVQVQTPPQSPVPEQHQQQQSQPQPPTPQPRQSQQPQQTYTDPATGETYQERMI